MSIKERTVVTDSSDPAQIAAAEEYQDDLQGDIKWIMGSYRGRRWMYQHIYGTCHTGSQSFVPGDHDATVFNEGGRAVGASLEAQLREWPELYMKMLAENHFGGPLKVTVN